MKIFQQIKALFAFKSFITTELREGKMVTESGKPGWRTTEFWMNLAGQVAVLWGAVHGFIPQPWASIISISGIAVYTIARTITKAIGDVQAAKAGTLTPAQ